MPRLLRVVLPITAALLAVLSGGGIALASGFGGGYGGTSGSSIWASAWWEGSPDGGPFTGPPSDYAGECIWHDVGKSVADLGDALSEADLPESFWTEPLSGGHPGIWGVLDWATLLQKKAKSGDHFDLVACPSAGQLPASGKDVETSLPEATPPSGPPLYVWIFWDTVAKPPSSDLPPVIEEAFSKVGLPGPTVHTSPSEIDGIAQATVVNLATWLWIDSGIWRSYSATAQAGNVIATAWAFPVSVTWTASWDFPSAADDPEKATTLSAETLTKKCTNAGLAYGHTEASGGPTPCRAVFAEPTLGTYQPLTATVTWEVHWAVANGDGVVGGEGLLPDVTTSASTPLRVMQVEAVISSG